MRLGLALAAALAGAAWAAQALDPLARSLSDKERSGRRLLQMFTDSSLEPPLVVALLQAGKDKSELVIYSKEGFRAPRLYDETFDGRLELDSSLGKERLADMLRDGSRQLLFNLWDKDGRRRTLHVVRVDKGRAKELGAFAEGEAMDLGASGKPEVVILERSFPWESFTPRQCPAFQDLGRAARSTEVLSWTGKKFKLSTSRHPDYFTESVMRDEAELENMGAAKEKKPGEWLGRALTVYYDYAAKGERKRGWERFAAAVKSTGRELPAQAECLERIRREIRGKLMIPDEWL